MQTVVRVRVWRSILLAHLPLTEHRALSLCLSMYANLSLPHCITVSLSLTDVVACAHPRRYECLTAGYTPYIGMSNSMVLATVITGGRAPIPSACPPELFELIKSCWQADADSRPKFDEILHTLCTLATGTMRFPTPKPPTLEDVGKLSVDAALTATTDSSSGSGAVKGRPRCVRVSALAMTGRQCVGAGGWVGVRLVLRLCVNMCCNVLVCAMVAGACVYGWVWVCGCVGVYVR